MRVWDCDWPVLLCTPHTQQMWVPRCWAAPPQSGDPGEHEPSSWQKTAEKTCPRSRGRTRGACGGRGSHTHTNARRVRLSQGYKWHQYGPLWIHYVNDELTRIQSAHQDNRDLNQQQNRASSCRTTREESVQAYLLCSHWDQFQTTQGESNQLSNS